MGVRGWNQEQTFQKQKLSKSGRACCPLDQDGAASPSTGRHELWSLASSGDGCKDLSRGDGRPETGARQLARLSWAVSKWNNTEFLLLTERKPGPWAPTDLMTHLVKLPKTQMPTQEFRRQLFCLLNTYFLMDRNLEQLYCKAIKITRQLKTNK